MFEIKFSIEEKEALVQKLKNYFIEELKQEIGQFDAEFRLDFISKALGSYYYNQGLYDARAIVESKLASIDDELYAIEKEAKT